MLKSVRAALITFSAAGIVTAQTGRVPLSITDSYSGRPISGAAVVINSAWADRTDSTGVVLLSDVTPGIYSGYIAAAGYDTLSIPTIAVTSGLNNLLNYPLVKSAAYEEEEITVTGTRISPVDAPASMTTFTPYELTNTAGSVNDIPRVISSLPSVTQGVTGNFDNSLNVRGGHSRENMFLVDGIELDNISHYTEPTKSGGNIGFINSELAQQVDFYAGSFPAGAPGALSGIVDITLRSGSFLERKHQADLNIAGLGVITEGPFMKGNASYLFNARYTNLVVLGPLFLSKDQEVRYGDALAKLHFILNEKNSLFAHGIFSFDRGTDPDLDYFGRKTYYESYTQALGNLTWEYQHDRFTNRVLANYVFTDDNDSNSSENRTVWEYNGPFKDRDPELIQLGDTLFHDKGTYSDSITYHEQRKRKTLSLHDNVTIAVRGRDQLKMGLSGKLNRLELYDKSADINTELSWGIVTATDPLTDSIYYDTSWVQYGRLKDTLITAFQLGGYAEYVLNGKNMRLMTGVRGDYYELTRDYGFSPRVTLLLSPGETGTFTLGGGLNYQLPWEINEALLALTPNKGWITSGFTYPGYDQLELSRAFHASLGYRKELTGSHLLTSEIYLKYYDRQYEKTDPGTYTFEPSMNEAIREGKPYTVPAPNGKKRAYGFELTAAKKEYSRFHYSGGYALTGVENRYADGNWYRDENHVTHSGIFTVGFNFLKHHGIMLKGVLRSGLPYSAIIYDKTAKGYIFDPSKEYFSEQLPAMFTMDFRYSFRFHPSWGNVMGYIDVMNVTNNREVSSREVNTWMGYLETYMDGILPLLGVKVDF